MRQVPPDIGHVQCTIERNASGMNKFWPKYILKLSDGQVLLEAKKVAKSKTAYYRIEISSKKSTDEHYLGRLRADISNHQFVIFDSGVKEKEMHKG